MGQCSNPKLGKLQHDYGSEVIPKSPTKVQYNSLNFKFKGPAIGNLVAHDSMKDMNVIDQSQFTGIVREKVNFDKIPIKSS